MALHEEDLAESKRWENGKKGKKEKRCKATSAQGMRCDKVRSHVKTDLRVTHTNGPWIWHADARNLPKGLTASYGILDEVHPMASVEFATAPMGGMFEPLPEAAEDRFRESVPTAENELRGWWFDQAEAEIEGTVRKAIEYSSTDLLDLGKTLAYLAGRDVSDEEAEELGVFFYLQGKMSRWAGAIKTGRRVSDDTLFDISVYCRMAQRIRHAGNWPGINLRTEENPS